MIDRAIQHVCRTRMSIIIELLLMGVGMMQWMRARLSDVPLSTQTWGTWALAMPLEAWALAMMGGSLLTLLGLLYPPSFRLIIIGCLVQAAHIGALGLSAALSGGDPVISAFAFGLLLPLHAIIAARAWHGY